MNGTALQLFRLNLKTPSLGDSPTLKAVAAETNLSPGNLSSFERGEKALGLRSKIALATVYGVTTEELDALFDSCRRAWLEHELAALVLREKARADSRPARFAKRIAKAKTPKRKR